MCLDSGQILYDVSMGKLGRRDQVDECGATVGRQLHREL